MFPTRLLAVAAVLLLTGVGGAQDKKEKEKKSGQSIKLTVEAKGTLRQQFVLGGDSFWRMQFNAKGGGSLRMWVEVGEETWVLTLPDDGKMPAEAAKLVGKEVVIQGTLEAAPPGFHGVLPSPSPKITESHHIRVTSVKAADAK